MRRRDFLTQSALGTAALFLRPDALCNSLWSQERKVEARRLVDDIWTPAHPASGSGKLVAAPADSVSGPSAGLPTLVPNDPGYAPDWGATLGIPGMIGELQQRMAAGLVPQTVYIAVMDGSIMSHPDLDPVHATQFDADFTGKPPGDPTLGSHATGVASIACAVTNNAMGAASVAGFTRSVKFFSVRIFDIQSNTSVEAILSGFNYILSLASQGVPVVAVACAFGGAGEIDSERDAIKALTDKGVVVFAGAGELTNGPFYPASYADTNPLVVPVSSLSVMRGEGRRSGQPYPPAALGSGRGCQLRRSVPGHGRVPGSGLSGCIRNAERPRG